MTKRILALLGAMALLLTFFTACGNNGGTPTGGQNQKNDPQLVIAANPVFVYDGNDQPVVAYNDLNKAMAADSQASSLTAITDSAWAWAYHKDGGLQDRAVYGFGRWTSGAGAKAKGAFAYAFNEAGSISLGVYDAKKNELVTYQDKAVPDYGVLLSAVAGEEEAFLYTVPQDGVMTIPEGTLTAVEQVAGVKTGFLAEDGTARSASVRIMVNSEQVFSGTLKNTTAAEDGVAVTQLTYPRMDAMHVKAGDTVMFCLKLDAQANSDEDVTAPTIDEDDNWQIVKASKTVVKDNSGKNDSDIMNDDGSLTIIRDYQFSFSVVRDSKYSKIIGDMQTKIEKRTLAEVFYVRADKEEKYELIIGANTARPESVKIYEEIKNNRADNADDFIIRLIGTKLYIVGGNDDALVKAIDYFLEKFVKDDKGKLPANYEYYNKPAHVVYTIAGQNIAGYTIRTERYPSLMVQRAAEAVQQVVLDNCGYRLPIKEMNIAGTDNGANEIRVGPMNGSVKIDRDYDVRFDSSNWATRVHYVQPDGMLTGNGYGHYQVGWDGNSIEIEGGSAYAVNLGTVKMLEVLQQQKALTSAYTTSGNYTSAYDTTAKTAEKGYATVDFALTDGFGLTYAEEFDYLGDESQKDIALHQKWNYDTDGNSPDTDGGKFWERRTAIYGKNFWVDTADTAGNNYLFEAAWKNVVAKGDSDNKGFTVVRLSAQFNWGFRFGIWETRLVAGTRNGACSGVWSITMSPYSTNQAYHEIDVYENYGQEAFLPCYHRYSPGRYEGEYLFNNGRLQTDGWTTPREGEHFYDTFHHVSVDWTYDYIRTYYDGKLASEMMLTDSVEMNAFRNGQVIRLANGAGNTGYTATQHPSIVPDGAGTRNPDAHSYNAYWWMESQGKSIDDWFEFQLVDYARVYQTDNATIPYKNAENNMKFAPNFGKTK